MKPPSVFAATVARDRAASGRRLVHMRANLANRKSLPLSAGIHRVSPARACLDEAIARHELREARRRAGAEAVREYLAARVPKATLDKMREDAGLAAGEPGKHVPLPPRPAAVVRTVPRERRTVTPVSPEALRRIGR